MERRMKYAWHKKPPQRVSAKGEVRWAWWQHMEASPNRWQEGPNNRKLRALRQLITQEQWKWKNRGEEHRMPRQEEEGVACTMYRNTTREPDVGVAYHGHWE